MADPIGSSYGFGIGEQWRLTDMSPLIAHERARREAMQNKILNEKAKAEQKEKSDFDKITARDFKVDPSRYDPKVLPIVIKANADAYNEALKLRNSGDSNWRNQIPAIRENLIKTMNLEQENTRAIKGYREADAKLVYKDENIAKSFNQNFGDKSDIPNDPANGFTIDRTTGRITYDPQPILDTKHIRDTQVFNNPKLYTEQKTVDSWLPNGQLEKKTISIIPDVALASQNEALLSNKNYAFNAMKEYSKATGEKIPDDFNTNVNFSKKVASWHLQKLKDEQGQIIKDQIGSRVPQSRAEKESDKVQRIIPQTEREITITYDLENPKTGEAAYLTKEGTKTYDKAKADVDASGNPKVAREDRSVTVRNYAGFGKPVTKQLAVDKVLLVGTGKEKKFSGNPQIDYSGVGEFPYTFDSSGNMILVDKKNIPALEKSGKIKWGEFAIGRIGDTGLNKGQRIDQSVLVPYTEELKNSIERSDKNPKGEVIIERKAKTAEQPAKTKVDDPLGIF